MVHEGNCVSVLWILLRLRLWVQIAFGAANGDKKHLQEIDIGPPYCIPGVHCGNELLFV